VNSLNANELLKLKIKRTDFISIRDHEELSELFEDIIVDNNQAREVAQLYTNILNGTMEAYASIISNNLNKFINRLTVITVILMVPTLVASFFGMNVPMPFDMGNSNASFYLIIFCSLAFSMLLIWFFRRKDVL
jgi:magnesium transporter